MKDDNKNRLRAQDIHKIVDMFTRQVALPDYARMMTFKQIEDNDYNLNIPRYIDSTDGEDLLTRFAEADLLDKYEIGNRVGKWQFY